MLICLLGYWVRIMIREASVDDVDEIVHVINESNYHAYRSIIPDEYFKHPIVSRDEILEDMRRMKFYVYEVEGRIVGVAALHPKPDEKVGIIRWVYVHPEYQRKGIGTALIKHIENTALSLNLEKLRLVTHGKAYWAIRFYEKLGYRAVSYIQRIAWKDILIEKTLKQ